MPTPDRFRDDYDPPPAERPDPVEYEPRRDDRHRVVAFTYDDGHRHGWECRDCDAGAVGFYRFSAAVEASHGHAHGLHPI